jgi:hypothetical protein
MLHPAFTRKDAYSPRVSQNKKMFEYGSTPWLLDWLLSGEAASSATGV